MLKVRLLALNQRNMAKKKIEEMSESELLYKLLSERVGAVDPHRVFYFKEGTNAYYLGGKKLTDNQSKTLKAEAGAIRQTGLYKVLCETLSFAAHRSMFEEMKTLEDSHYGKALLYNVSVIQKVVENIANIQISPPIPKM